MDILLQFESIVGKHNTTHYYDAQQKHTQNTVAYRRVNRAKRPHTMKITFWSTMG
jgi:hypothetical protein